MSLFKDFRKTFKIKHYINYIILTVFFLAVFMLDSSGMLTRSSQNLMPRIFYSIILAISLNLVVGFLGELSLGHAGFMCVGAYIGCYFSLFLNKLINNTVISFIASLFIGGLVAAIFGFIIGLPALRLKGDYLAIVTLAFGEIVRNVFKNLPFFGGAMGLQTSEIKIKSSSLYVYSFLIALIILILIQNLIRSKHGRAITAIRDNEIAAKAMGINVTFYKLFVFVISSFFAGVAGSIYGHYITPISYSRFDYNYSIEILVMVVIGGIGSITGSIISAAVITYINFILQDSFTGNLAAVRLLVYALILIIIVIFNNAPALKPFKEKVSLKNIYRNFVRKKHPEKFEDDDAAWNRIESKINMDEMLSVGISPSDNSSNTNPKKSTKDGK